MMNADNKRVKHVVLTTPWVNGSISTVTIYCSDGSARFVLDSSPDVSSLYMQKPTVWTQDHKEHVSLDFCRGVIILIVWGLRSFHQTCSNDSLVVSVGQQPSPRLVCCTLETSHHTLSILTFPGIFWNHGMLHWVPFQDRFWHQHTSNMNTTMTTLFVKTGLWPLAITWLNNEKL